MPLRIVGGYTRALMDTTTLQMLTSVISGLLSGGAGAGTQELLERLGKLRERSGAPATLPASEAGIDETARGLLAAAEQDESLRDALAQWLTDAQKRVSPDLVVNNTVSGVIIGGSIIQTGIAPKHCPPRLDTGPRRRRRHAVADRQLRTDRARRCANVHDRRVAARPTARADR
jgi:hypothetical protein